MVRSKHFYIRRSHRYLGIVLGIQFLMWTLGGLYFSWSNMDEIHGDFQRKDAPLLSADIKLVSPSQVMDSIKAVHQVDSLVSIQLIEILGKPYYQVRCISAMQGSGMEHHDHGIMNHLADAETGSLRLPLSKEESVQVAVAHFNEKADIKQVEYLSKVDGHHEYRESPLPAYQIEFDHPSKTRVYVSTELGTVEKFRNQKWRIFDFLWMMHTMDYEGRDNFGNLALRVFSIFGLITVFSGFLLFFVSAKWRR
jgi:hypothetical protein